MLFASLPDIFGTAQVRISRVYLEMGIFSKRGANVGRYINYMEVRNFYASDSFFCFLICPCSGNTISMLKNTGSLLSSFFYYRA